ASPVRPPALDWQAIRTASAAPACLHPFAPHSAQKAADGAARAPGLATSACRAAFAPLTAMQLLFAGRPFRPAGARRPAAPEPPPVSTVAAHAGASNHCRRGNARHGTAEAPGPIPESLLRDCLHYPR